MGKIRNFLSQFIKFTPKKNVFTPICSHQILLQKQRFTKLIVNSNDQCKSCNQKICLVCSQVHIQQHCNVNMRTNKNIGEGTLKQFNLGYLMKLSLDNVRCICGTTLNSKNAEHAICAACGLASCSVKCHHGWEQQGNCTYHQNYYQKPASVNMRSILMLNIQHIQQANIKELNLANKSSLSYIACYAKAGKNEVYLQRGYRNYGIPQPQLVEKMIKINFGLDYTTHIERVCTCTCQTCIQRQIHSKGNCEFSCKQMSHYNSLQYRDQPQQYFQCQCDCKFCSSGIVVSRHTKVQCILFCYKSHYNVNNIS